jgi:hypothetical protein
MFLNDTQLSCVFKNFNDKVFNYIRWSLILSYIYCNFITWYLLFFQLFVHLKL